MKLRIILWMLLFPIFLNAQSDQIKTLTLTDAIKLASDSSLAAFKAKNIYLSSYWQYRTYKAERLPGISLEMTPVSYSNNFVKRYDYINNRDIYKTQQNLYSYANLSLRQNIDWTGGVVYIDTELGYLKNMGATSYQQFNTIPFRIGYSQSLFGYNLFKWERKIEPLKYEKAKSELIYDLEEIAEQTTILFFEVAMNETLVKLTQQNILNADSLYHIGTERYKIGSISHSDLLSLKLNVIDAQTSIGNAEYSLQKSRYSLMNMLHLDNDEVFSISIPEDIMDIEILPIEAIYIAKDNNPVYLEQKQNILIAEQSLDKTVKSARFTANLSASVGYNQVSDELMTVYNNPQRQDIVSVQLSVPLVDWGTGKGKVNVAKRNLDAVKISAELAEQMFEQDILSVLQEFKLRQSQIQLAKEAREIANQALIKAKQLFIIGKAEVNTINSTISKQIESELEFISALNQYWVNYYRIRKLTLYDFAVKQSISTNFEVIHGY